MVDFASSWTVYLIDIYDGESVVINKRILSEDIIMIKKSHKDKKIPRVQKYPYSGVCSIAIVSVEITIYDDKIFSEYEW